MTWDYRVIRRVQNGEATYAIHEVYFNRAGRAVFLTEEAVEPMGETLEELQQDWARMGNAFMAPVLDYETRQAVEPAPLVALDQGVHPGPDHSEDRRHA